MTLCHHLPSRREALLGAGALFAWSQMPRLARAEGRDPRLLVIVLRGALDGLGAVAPVGDPDWVGLRGDRALLLDGKTPALPLDAFFALNPAMPNLHRLYKAQQASIVHATATPYRERSHFDGQDVLESGIARPGTSTPAGSTARWSALESDGRVRSARQPRPGRRRGYAAGGARPGAGDVVGAAAIAARQRRHPGAAARPLSAHRPELAVALEARMRLAALGRTGVLDQSMPEKHRAGAARHCAPARLFRRGRRHGCAAFSPGPTAPGSARRLCTAGIRTSTRAPAAGQLANLLGALDGALAAIETNMGDAWRETVVAVITEFGRTARINGTDGTDHGTGTVAFLAGGALRGGRVVADWPGLKAAQLYEERDLKPTTDLRAVLKGLLRDHLRVDERVLATTVFPDSADVAPTAGLVG